MSNYTKEYVSVHMKMHILGSLGRSVASHSKFIKNKSESESIAIRSKNNCTIFNEDMKDCIKYHNHLAA